MNKTKRKILDAAERLFGEQGYSAVSIRQIVAQAGVNLAAIHYHFGSKEEVLVQMVAQHAHPLNDARLALLDRFEQEHGPGPLPLVKVLEAFLLPSLEMSKARPQFFQLMARLHAEGVVTEAFKKPFEAAFRRFHDALTAALPGIPEEDLAWRSHFMFGAVAFAMGGTRISRPKTGDSPPIVLRRLIEFLSAGLQAPVSEVRNLEVGS